MEGAKEKLTEVKEDVKEKLSKASEKVKELNKKIERAREDVKKLPGIALTKEEQAAQLNALKKQLKVKQELLARWFYSKYFLEILFNAHDCRYRKLGDISSFLQLGQQD